MQAQMLKDSSTAAAIGLLVGFALHAVTVYARDHGPALAGYSLRGNGAIVLLLLAPLILVVAEVVCFRQRAWLGTLAFPLTMLLGLFVVLGGV